MGIQKKLFSLTKLHYVPTFCNKLDISKSINIFSKQHLYLINPSYTNNDTRV